MFNLYADVKTRRSYADRHAWIRIEQKQPKHRMRTEFGYNSRIVKEKNSSLSVAALMRTHTARPRLIELCIAPLIRALIWSDVARRSDLLQSASNAASSLMRSENCSHCFVCVCVCVPILHRVLTSVCGGTASHHHLPPLIKEMLCAKPSII